MPLNIKQFSLPHPENLWEQYRDHVYKGNPLVPAQELECSRAFSAGIEATFKVINTVIGTETVPEEVRAIVVRTFREVNKDWGTSL